MSGTNWEDGDIKGVQPSVGCNVPASNELLTAVNLANQAHLKTQFQALQLTETIQKQTQTTPTPFRLTPKTPDER